MLKIEFESFNKEESVNPRRFNLLNKKAYKKGKVVYWMQRDQRVDENWALIFAQEFAIDHNQDLVVVFNLVDDFLGANIRKYDFMIKGLKKLEQKLSQKKIPLYVLKGEPAKNIPDFLNEHKAGALVTDFNPLKIKQKWEADILKQIDIPFVRVDAHNICPAWEVSEKKEIGARTLRPKIQKGLIEFLTEFPSIKKMENQTINYNRWVDIFENLNVDKTVKAIDWLIPGEIEAKKVLKDFIDNKLDFYAEKRNDPNENVLSNLSVYLHFGHISAQKVALEVIKSKASIENKEAFLEELIVRKELSDNYCYYNKNYDNLDSVENWVKQTFEEHKNDIRAYIYTKEEFEKAKTHDELWNAAQLEMVKKGKMHGYLRMYWAKKILEWTDSYNKAFEIAIYLNDKYEIDGCDPNGYVGVAWSIAGVHDRAWQTRDVFGKIRYMNYNGCKNKFDVDKYINKIKML